MAKKHIVLAALVVSVMSVIGGGIVLKMFVLGPTEGESLLQADRILPPGLWVVGTSSDGYQVHSSLDNGFAPTMIAPTPASWSSFPLKIAVVEVIEDWQPLIAFTVVEKSSGECMEYVVYDPRTSRINTYPSVSSGHAALMGSGLSLRDKCKLRRWYHYQ